MIKRRNTKTVKIGSVKIGSKYPVSIQSMTKTDTNDVNTTVKQIKELEKAGCEIVRVAVRDLAAAQALDKIRAKINIPLVADVHFNFRLALEAIARSIDGLRLNPGNIYRSEEIKQIARAAKKKKISLRVGVNSGSLRKYNKLGNYNRGGLPIYRQKGKRYLSDNVQGRQRTEKLADSMVRYALNYIKMLESFDFYDIIVSLKASDVVTTVRAYERMAKFCNYPFHLGITASGLPKEGAIKSAIGIGSLLLAGIGDTIRVSLTANPLEETSVAKGILQSLGLRNFGPEIIACPSCGRCEVNLVRIVNMVQNRLNTLYIKYRTLDSHLPKIAIMGCEVNGPGEAADADIGVACGKNSAALFKKGKIIKNLKESEIVDTLIQELVNS
jgi:(E)-4-hydroxy-3-methylbut-2-enyl-diphosphate synthase